MLRSIAWLHVIFVYAATAAGPQDMNDDDDGVKSAICNGNCRGQVTYLLVDRPAAGILLRKTWSAGNSRWALIAPLRPTWLEITFIFQKLKTGAQKIDKNLNVVWTDGKEAASAWTRQFFSSRIQHLSPARKFLANRQFVNRMKTDIHTNRINNSRIITKVVVAAGSIIVIRIARPGRSKKNWRSASFGTDLRTESTLVFMGSFMAWSLRAKRAEGAIKRTKMIKFI